MLKTIERLKEKYSHATLTKTEALNLAIIILNEEIENAEGDDAVKLLEMALEDINVEHFGTDDKFDGEFDKLHFLTLDDIDSVIDTRICFAYGTLENEQYTKELEDKFEN